MQKTIFEKYLEGNPAFIDEIKALPTNLSDKFLREFKKEKNRINFLSRLSEFYFIQLFAKQGFVFDYEYNIYGKTPDIKIEIEGKSIFGDVKRFNPSEENMAQTWVLHELVQNLKTIEVPLHLKISQIKSTDKQLIIDDTIINDIKNWILSNMNNTGEKLVIHDSISIEIRHQHKISNRLIFTLIPLVNKSHDSKVISVVKEKIKNYKCIIEKGFPFFVCIDLVFDAFVAPSDFELYYLGEEWPRDLLDRISSSEAGLFFNDENISQIFGILIRYNKEFYWLKNPNSIDILKFNNLKSA